MYFEKIVNVQTGEETIREFTAEEIAKAKEEEAKANNRMAEMEARANARLSLLTKLGITEEEAKLLLS